MRIMFAGRNSSQGLKDNDPTSLQSVALDLGHSIATTLQDGPDVLLVADFNKIALSLVSEARKRGIPSLLIISEPAVVVPEHAKQSIRAKFSGVIEIGRPGQESFVPWPQTWRDLDLRAGRLHRAVMINADKWSFAKGSLYGLRAKAAAELECLDVFGHGWGRRQSHRALNRVKDLIVAIRSGASISFKYLRYVLSLPTNFRGGTLDKVETMARYRVALVIENSQELITEKLFDAFFAGCFPVYVGPPLSKLGIPEHLAVQSSGTMDEIERSINVALNVDFQQHFTNLSSFLNAEQTRDHWDSSRVFSRVLDRVGFEIGVKSHPNS